MGPLLLSIPSLLSSHQLELILSSSTEDPSLERLPIDRVVCLNMGFLGALLDRTIHVVKDLKVCITLDKGLPTK